MSSIQRTISAPKAIAAVFLLTTALIAGGCNRGPAPETDLSAGNTPVAAVNQLVKDLRSNDLVGYAAHALPPALHQDIAIAWSEGRTTWPLSELPLSDQIPDFVIALAAPDAEKTLIASFGRQFSGAERELRTTASTLGMFATQYVERSDDYSDPEREHLTQLLAALSSWGVRAPLSNPARAKVAVPQLVAAARLTGLGTPNALQQTGMERSLARLGPLLGRLKKVLFDYGLDIDSALDGAQARLIEQTGDTAKVALAYTLSGHLVEARILLERQDGRWYLTDLVRHAEAQSRAERPADTPTGGDVTSTPRSH